MASGSIAGCADENDPATHVKKLSDSSTRAPAVNRLIQFFEDAMTRDKDDRNGPTVKPLLDLIVRALNDEFAPDVLESARHLAAIDPRPPRGATVLGAVLLQLRDFAGARDVLEGALARHGHDAYLLANLARAYAALGDEEFKHALRQARAGEFSERSWHYWHLVLGLAEPHVVPPPPRRKL